MLSLVMLVPLGQKENPEFQEIQEILAPLATQASLVTLARQDIRVAPY